MRPKPWGQRQGDTNGGPPPWVLHRRPILSVPHVESGASIPQRDPSPVFPSRCPHRWFPKRGPQPVFPQPGTPTGGPTPVVPKLGIPHQRSQTERLPPGIPQGESHSEGPESAVKHRWSPNRCPRLGIPLQKALTLGPAMGNPPVFPTKGPTRSVHNRESQTGYPHGVSHARYRPPGSQTERPDPGVPKRG
jgi:hypothetical protein